MTFYFIISSAFQAVVCIFIVDLWLKEQKGKDARAIIAYNKEHIALLKNHIDFVHAEKDWLWKELKKCGGGKLREIKDNGED